MVLETYIFVVQSPRRDLNDVLNGGRIESYPVCFDMRVASDGGGAGGGSPPGRPEADFWEAGGRLIGGSGGRSPPRETYFKV